MMLARTGIFERCEIDDATGHEESKEIPESDG